MIWRCFAIFLPVIAYTQVSVTTYRNDLARTGQNLNEHVLTPSNVSPGQFGKLFSQPLDGQAYAQPLYLPSVRIPGKGVHNLVLVATEHDSVYAFDADSNLGANAGPLWHVSLAGPGERPAGVADVLNCSAIAPEIGITGTPVIDASTGTLYVVALTSHGSQILQRLHALDAATGAERPGSPIAIAASIPGTGSGIFDTAQIVDFDPSLQYNRTGLLLLNGVVYVGWSSHCDTLAFHGWITGYDARDLHQTAVFNTSPDAYEGSFWMSGAAPAADSEGNIYAISGNGEFDANSGGRDVGDSILKLSPQQLAIEDYFTPFNQRSLAGADLDLGSSGPVLLPDEAGSTAHQHLLAAGGKEGRIYLIDRDRMGGFHTDADTQIVQSIAGATGPLYGQPAYFNRTLYFAPAYDRLKAFPISGAQIDTTPLSEAPQPFGYGGAVPVISADGLLNGIVWVVESTGGGTLHAYDASNLAHELFNTGMNAARDTLGLFVRFSVPTVAEGRVYVGTANSLAVYGLLNQPSPATVVNALSYRAGPVAPGSLITIFGSHLAPTAATGQAPLPHNLGGVSLTINGFTASLLYVSPTQINAQVPTETIGGWAAATLEVSGAAPVLFTFPVAVRPLPMRVPP